MPGAFKVFEDATLRARAIFGIFERGVPSSDTVRRLRARKPSSGSARRGSRGRDFTRVPRVVDVSRRPIVTIEPDRPVRVPLFCVPLFCFVPCRRAPT